MANPLQVLDGIQLNFSPGGLLFMNITLAFIMFGVALEIDLKNFRQVLSRPKALITGVLSQFVLLPFLTFLLVYLIRPTPSVALGMILVAACPGGNLSNFMSLLAKGNVALSVSLTAIATVSAIFMTPFNFAFYGNLYGEASRIIMPIEIDAVEMFKTVVVLLGIPLVLGMLFAWQFPGLAKKITKPMKVFSIVVFGGFVVAALASNFGYFLRYIHLIFLLVLAHNALALGSGYLFARVMKLNSPDRRSITIETGIQNSGLGLVLIFNPHIFNGLGGMAFIAAWWGIWHILSGLAISSWWAKRPYSQPPIDNEDQA
jgi:bile acid:Na+ symporter, BASS family